MNFNTILLGLAIFFMLLHSDGSRGRQNELLAELHASCSSSHSAAPFTHIDPENRHGGN